MTREGVHCPVSELEPPASHAILRILWYGSSVARRVDALRELESRGSSEEGARNACRRLTGDEGQMEEDGACTVEEPWTDEDDPGIVGDSGSSFVSPGVMNGGWRASRCP